MHIRPLLIAILTALLIAGPGLPAGSARANDCSFTLGFKALHDMIPSIVGDCKVNEHHNPDNGDGLQETTGGLLVWRKADNWTAFTDGYHTWINGPYGLQQRLNTDRFPWEQGLINPGFFYSAAAEPPRVYSWPNFPTGMAQSNGSGFARLHWSRPDENTAVATGDWIYNNCDPYCVNGKIISTPVTITASQPNLCRVSALQADGREALKEVYIYTSVHVSGPATSLAGDRVIPAPSEIGPHCQ
jgi:hypothetical protein